MNRTRFTLGTGDLDNRLALGQSSDWPRHPERVFTFGSNLGNLGGSWDKDGRDNVIAILDSTVPNPGFNPTHPTDNSAGDPVMKPFDPMATPKIGQITPDSSWKTLKVSAGNVSVRYPSSVPLWAGLIQHAAAKACYQRNLNYGGAEDVYLGSADNGANPTKKELREDGRHPGQRQPPALNVHPPLGRPAYRAGAPPVRMDP